MFHLHSTRLTLYALKQIERTWQIGRRGDVSVKRALREGGKPMP